MQINHLLAREPFGAILQNTLTPFLASWAGKPYAVSWQPTRLRRVAAQTQVWLCNPRLNAIFVSDASSAVFGHVRREFSRALSPWRRPFQRAYVRAATVTPFSPLLSQYRVLITPALDRARELLITGGNARLRLVDTGGGVVYGILKNGVSRNHLDREVSTRRLAAHSGVPVPEVVQVDSCGRWFAERFVKGTPVNRLTATEMARCFDVALKSLQGLVRDSVRDESSDRYVTGLAQRTLDLLGSVQVVTRNQRDKLEETISRLVVAVSSARSLGAQTILTAMTHGDLQAGNILAEAGRTWLIDWEHSGRRQAGYDWLVANLGPRFPEGLASRITSFEAQPDRVLPFGRTSVPKGIQWTTTESRRFHAAVFLLEEIAFRLENAAALPHIQSDPGLVVVGSEASLWLDRSIN